MCILKHTNKNYGRQNNIAQRTNSTPRKDGCRSIERRFASRPGKDTCPSVN